MVKDPMISVLEREPKLSDRVAQQLQGLVLGHFNPGDRLPSERELATRFGVSRTVIREAVRSLMTKGLLEVRTGSGTLVRALGPESAAESMSLLIRLRSGELDYKKVIEVRRMLEVEIAGYAAERRTQANLDEIEAIMRLAHEQLTDPETFIKTDIAFHAALARATQNELFVALLDSIADVLIEGRRLALSVPGTPARALAYHSDVLDCVKVGDVEGARQAMNRHMDEARSTMQRAFGQSHSQLKAKS